jgi:hypothetical protein
VSGPASLVAQKPGGGAEGGGGGAADAAAGGGDTVGAGSATVATPGVGSTG